MQSSQASAVEFPQTDHLWQEYKSTGCQAVRDQLIATYMPLVEIIAKKIISSYHAQSEYDDLVGYGMLGLIDAIQRYLPELGTKFETYATFRIHGSIIDGLRSRYWGSHATRAKARQISAVTERLEKQLGRSATDAEIADALGITVAQFEQVLADLDSMVLLSLYESPDNTDVDPLTIFDITSHSSSEDPPAAYEQKELLELLAAAIDELPERERLLIALYYHEELTLKEIGAVLGVSESRVSQLHNRALLRLRAKISSQA